MPSLNIARWPVDSWMSISPLIGQLTVVLGSIQNAGHRPRPATVLMRASKRPFIHWPPRFRVRRRAEVEFFEPMRSFLAVIVSRPLATVAFAAW